jgi:FMN-dependent NADH-azoreductase
VRSPTFNTLPSDWPNGSINADIVHDLIIENRENHPGIEFVELDVLKDPLPRVDGWLARDLMIHLQPGAALPFSDRPCNHHRAQP